MKTCQLSHSEKIFHEQNQYPFWEINKVFCEIKQSNHQQLHEQHQQQLPTNSSREEVPNSKKHFPLLQYKGKRSDNITKSMNYYRKLLTPK